MNDSKALSPAAVMALWIVNVKVCKSVHCSPSLYENGEFRNGETYRKINWLNDCPLSLRGALAGWVHWWSTEGQVGDEDAADGRQPWGLDERAKTQCWLLRLEHGLSICHVHTSFMCNQSCCDFVSIEVYMYIKEDNTTVIVAIFCL